jgi:iron complex transport system permease protein
MSAARPPSLAYERVPPRGAHWGPLRLLITLAVCLLAWAAIALACLCVGSTDWGWPAPSLLVFRRESVLVASLVGAALGAAGATYQAVLRNPLADPYLLGVSSGASLAVYIWPLLFGAAPALLGSVSQQVFAFAGGAASVAVVFLLAQRRGRLEPVTMLLVGVIVNAVNGAVFLLVHYLTRRYVAAGQSGDVLAFLVGAFNTNLTPQQKTTAAVCVFAGVAVLLYLSGALAVAGLGDAEAESLGVRVHRVRWVALIAASFVTASAVAVSGPIGFVGLVCPHLARLIVGTDVRRLLPVAIALGACLLAVADAGSRRMGQLPVGVLTGLLGGPFFLFLLWRDRRRVGS